MKSVYIFSPLPPVQSSQAEYAHVLARELVSRYGYDVHVVVNQNEIPGERNYQVHHWKELLYRPGHRDGSAIIYQLVNDPYHQYILPFLFTDPGILVLHEFFPDLNPYMIEASICILMHNPDRPNPDSAVYYVPYGVYKSELLEDLSAEKIRSIRDQMGIPQDALILCAPSAEEKQKVEKIARRIGIKEFVTSKEELSAEDYSQLLRVADIFYSLEFPTTGEFSASALEAMATAKPVIMVQHRFNAYFPEDTVIHVRPTQEWEDLLHHTQELSQRPELRKAIGEQAREYVIRHHSLTGMLDCYRSYVEGYDYFRRTWKDRRSGFPWHLRPLRLRILEQLTEKFPKGVPDFLLEQIRVRIGSLI